MQRRTERELRDSDAALLMLNGEQTIGAGDRFIAAAVKAADIPCVVAVNKTDAPNHERTVTALVASAELDLPAEAEIFPISARSGAGVDGLLEALVGLLPERPFLYPPAEATDLSPAVRLAELVREQVLERTRQEIPHAVEVEVEELEERPGGALVVRALLYAETDSQKGILVGAGGSMVRGIGTGARAEIEALTGRRVHLDLAVRVRRGWRGDEALQVETDVREDYEAKLTDDYPNARVRSVRCVEENESRLECAARLSGADTERTQLDVVGAPDDFVWEEAN